MILERVILNNKLIKYSMKIMNINKGKKSKKQILIKMGKNIIKKH